MADGTMRKALTGAVLAALLLPSVAQARVYPAPVFVTNEDDLRNLYEDGLLGEDELQVLIELLNNPLNLNNASRGELYDLPGVTFAMAGQIVAYRTDDFFETPSDLLEIDGFDEDVLVQVLPFVYAGSEIDSRGGVSGSLKVRTAVFRSPSAEIEGDHANRTHTVDQLGYEKLPDTMAIAQVRYGNNWSFGTTLLLQEGIRGVAYNPESRDFSASYGMYGELGRAYGRYDNGRVDVIVGSYSAGFGQGLTFDRTSRQTPNGFYTDLSTSAALYFERWRLPRRLNGVAATVDLGRVGGWHFESTVFASSTRYDVYQYHVGMLGGEEWSEYSEAGDSPRVYIDGQKVGWVTIPNAYRESLVGLNVRASSSVYHLGLTAYGGMLDTTTLEGMDEDNQIAVRAGYGTNDRYGAVGLDWGVTLQNVDLLGEATVTGTGGAGALGRMLVYPKGGEVELSLRRYGVGFDNPHASGIAEPDQYEGMRDRAEQGARVKGTYTVIDDVLTVQGTADLWQDLSFDTARVYNGLLYGRVQYRPHPMLRVDLYGKLTDQDLSQRGRQQEYGGDLDDFYFSDELGTEYDEVVDELGLAVGSTRAGMRTYYGTQLVFQPTESLKLSALYQRMYTDQALLYPSEVLWGGDDGAPCEYWFQIGQYGWVMAQFKPTDATRISARVRYRDEDVVGSRDERWTDAYLQVDQRVGSRLTVAARANGGYFLNDPGSEIASYCDTLSSPDLNGTCVVESEVDPGSESVPFGYLWLMVKTTF